MSCVRPENLGRLKKLEYLNLALNNIELIENLEGEGVCVVGADRAVSSLRACDPQFRQLSFCRLREPPETGPDGKLCGSPEQHRASEAQPSPGRTFSGGKPLQRVPELPAVRGGLTASA